MLRPQLGRPGRSHYGKGETVVYRLQRDYQAPPGELPVLGAKLTLFIWGEAFWPTYTSGDNTNLVATDSMKNFLQRETLNYAGHTLEGLAHFLAGKFMATYPQAEGAELYAEQIPFEALSGQGPGLRPASGPRATARVLFTRSGGEPVLSGLVCGLSGFELLRLSGSAFTGFVRDAYTTLPENKNRPLRMMLNAEWTFADLGAGLAARSGPAVRERVERTFEGFSSGSIQEVLYQMGTRVLSELPVIERLELEGQNHTWEAVAERDETLGVFTISKPFYGILGLSLTREDLPNEGAPG